MEFKQAAPGGRQPHRQVPGDEAAKMLMAYDFERKLNPFAELGGFIFTFMGDGKPGTGKTTLIQMMAGLIKGYCETAGYPFRYQNLSTESIDSYQGKSAQNAKAFINNVLDPSGDRLRHHRRHRPARRQARRPAVVGRAAGDHRGADGELCRGQYGGARQLHLRDVLELPRERRRRAAPAGRGAVPGRRAADARRLHRHPRAADGQEPCDPAGRSRALRRAGDQARGGRELRAAFAAAGGRAGAGVRAGVERTSASSTPSPSSAPISRPSRRPTSASPAARSRTSPTR